jgi:hypothetical protein
MEKLPEDSRQLMTDKIIANNWYPIRQAMVEPMRVICDLFYDKDLRGAWDSGRFAAEDAFHGVYKVLALVHSPQFLIEKASSVFSGYYQPSQFILKQINVTCAVLYILQFEEPSELVENRIAGWIERAMQLIGCQGIDVGISESLAKGGNYTEIVCRWD